MKNTHTISNSKIIAFVVFVFAAIMTSLFVYRFSHPAVATTLSADAGSLFPAARDIKDFKLQQAEGQAFTQKNLLNHWTLLFFGFTHCASICPTTLDMLQRAYAELHTTYPDLQIVLVSLDPERDSPAELASYTHSFNADFIGVTGNLQELRKLQSQFGVFAARDNATGNNYQLQHTASIMLINPKGQWAGLFRFGLNPQQFTQAFGAAVTRA
jgi:protein SCO1/2